MDKDKTYIYVYVCIYMCVCVYVSIYMYSLYESLSAFKKIHDAGVQLEISQARRGFLE